ncbi:unnamed protein product, partial [marine sediment metagenome]
PLPQFTDAFPAEWRATYSKLHPIRYAVINLFGGEIVADPLNWIWTAAVKGAGKIASGIGIKSYGKLATIATKHVWASQLQDLVDFNLELFRFITMKPVTKNFAQISVPTLDRYRSAFLKITSTKFLPYKFRQAINHTDSALSSGNKGVVLAEIDDAIRAVGKKYKAGPKILNNEIARYLAEPWKRPSDRVLEVFRRLGVSAYDIWDLSKKYPTATPILEDIIKTHAIARPRAEFVGRMLYEKYQTSKGEF